MRDDKTSYWETKSSALLLRGNLFLWRSKLDFYLTLALNWIRCMWNTEEIDKIGKPHFDHFCRKMARSCKDGGFGWSHINLNNCKFLDWLFIETRTCNKYLGIRILALSRTRDVFELQQSC